MQYDNTRTYLDRVVPWVEGAFIGLHWTVPNKKFDAAQPVTKLNKPFFLNGQGFKTRDDLVGHLSYIMTRPDTRDVYICMSAQTQVEEKVYANSGKTYYQIKRGIDFVHGLKSLYFDLDVKPGEPTKGYPDQTTAITELARFLRETGLPSPTLMVASGTGGAHGYFVLDRVLPLEEWSPLAMALAEATRRHGLVTDTACTVDSARLLRLPETWNRKRDQPLPVLLGQRVQPHDISVDLMRKLLTPYMGAQVHRLPTKPGVSATASLNSALTAGIQTAVARPVDITTIEPQCAFVRNSLLSGGAQNPQPLWNLSTLLASFTLAQDADGREIAHRMAKGHPGYTQADTDALYDRKVDERANRNVGWPSCQSIENSGCTDCAACPLRVHGKSPLSYGSAYVAPVQSIGVQPNPQGLTPSTTQSAGVQALHPAAHAGRMPRNYIVNPAGIVSRVQAEPDGTSKLIEVSPYPMHSGWVQTNPWVLHFVTRLGNNFIDTTIALPLTQLQSREYAKHIAAQGIVVSKYQTPEVQEFLLAWVQTLQSIKDAVVSSSPFGWAMQSGKLDGFVYNSRVWTPYGDKPAAIPNAVLEEHYKPHGDLEPWKAAAAFMTGQNRPALNAILASSFGAPLMKFTGQSGVIISAWSQKSGIGKTTMMCVSQAVWAHPMKAMNGLDDTQNSVMNKAGQLRALPLFWDELKGDDQKNRFVKVAFQISGGKEKSRLNSDATQRDPGTWQTIVIAASNESLLDTVQRQLSTTEAGILRVFEFEVPAVQGNNLHSHGHVSRLVARCHDNYGHAGLVYAKFLGENHARIAADMAALQDGLVTKLAAPNDERFWISAIACLMLGAKYGNELGLTNINEADLLRFLATTLNKLRDMRRTTAVDVRRPDALSSIFARFLGEMAGRYTLTTDHVHIGKGRPLANSAVLLGDHTRLDNVLVRHAKNDRKIIIVQSAFHDWLYKNEYSPHAVVEAMKEIFKIKTSVQLSPGSGTSFAGAGIRQHCIEVDYSGTGFVNLVDDEKVLP